MNLAQLVTSVRRKSFFTGSRESAIEAINEASRRVYNWIIKESPAKMFMKWDTSLSLVVGTQEYLLQPDLQQIIRIREFDPLTGRWRIIRSTSFNDIGDSEGSVVSSLATIDDDDSVFKFYGPYEKDDGKFYIQIEPNIDIARQLEIVYSAKFVEINGEGDYFMIPEEARGVVKDFAVAEMLDDVDDDAAQKIAQRGQNKLTEYLTLLRARQIQDTPKQEAYL